MKYFIANLSIHLLITLFFMILVIVFTNRNRKGQTKYPVSYFLPLVFSILTILHAIFFTAPRLLDISNLMTQNFYSYTGTLEEVSVLNNTFMVDGEKYFINPLWELPPEGTPVRIRYTSYSNFAIEVSLPEAVNVSDTINEEMQTTVQTTNE